MFPLRCSTACNPPCLNGVCLSSRPESQVTDNSCSPFLPFPAVVVVIAPIDLSFVAGECRHINIRPRQLLLATA